MQHPLEVRAPFDFSQTLAFMRRFPAVRDACLITDTSVTAAITLDGEAVPFTLRAARGGGVVVDAPADARVVACARDFIGADDDLAPFYAAAAGDAAFQPIVAALHGLHHVRFLTLEEIAVYCVLMQRTPITLAARMKQKFLARFGRAVRANGEVVLRAMPDMAELGALEVDAIAAALGHPRKAAMIVDVVRGVAALGEAFLRTAPYAVARDALLAIRGVGPFSAAAILLRGLGRMDELPWLPAFDDAGRAVYGSSFSRAAVERRYGRHIGYWAFYAKTGVARGR